MRWELLADVPDDEIRRVLSIARRRTFSRGEVVFHEHDPADSLHLVAKGRFAVRITTPLGESALLAIRGPGESFGELALVSGPEAVRSATVEALEAGETHAVYRREFDALRHEHPLVGDVLVAVLAEAVRRTNELLLDAYYAPAETRVLRRLRDLAAAFPDGEVRLTQEDLASLAGTSRATVNRVLRDAERRGAVELRRGRTVVRDPDALGRRMRSDGV
jgi:CRP/FNR family transcriptional regulator, cyclic AMP receptor protein